MTRALLALFVTVASTRRLEGPDAAARPDAPGLLRAGASSVRLLAGGRGTSWWAGKPAGTNRIESVMKGCGLLEQWTSAGGGHGTSLNFYDSTHEDLVAGVD